MITKTIALLADATNISIHSTANGITTLAYNSEIYWGSRRCFYIVSGHWEIKHINRNIVTLANYDTIIHNY